MAKGTIIPKFAIGQTTDPDEVNAAIKNAGSEEGSIPFDDGGVVDTDGEQPIGTQDYPFGDAFFNKNKELNIINPTTSAIVAKVSFPFLINFQNFLSAGFGEDGDDDTSSFVDMEGEYHFDNFTISSGNDLVVGALGYVVIRVKGTLTIVADIDGDGAGGAGGAGGAIHNPGKVGGAGALGCGTGGGGGAQSSVGGGGGDITSLFPVDGGGGGAVSGGAGSDGNRNSGSDKFYMNQFQLGYGSGGGGGGSTSVGGGTTNGGAGGGSILIIADTIVVTGTPSISCKGVTAGNASSGSGAGGGGGGGAVVIAYNNLTGTLPTPDISGGDGGIGSPPGGNGGDGEDGFAFAIDIQNGTIT